MKKRLIIWCEATCLKCGRVANASGWYSPDTIRNLKRETKSWQASDSNYGNLCPDCTNKRSGTHVSLGSNCK